MINQHDSSVSSPLSKVGEKVLVYFPMDGSSLSAKVSGPYDIIKVLSKSTYTNNTPKRRKSLQQIHIKQLKP